MASVSVTYTFSASTTAVSGEVNTNFTDLTTYINNRNDGSTTWDAVSVAHATNVPLIVNNSTGTQDIARFQDNGTNKVKIADGGILTYPSISARAYNSAAIAMTTGTWTTMTLDTERFDTDTLHSTASNTGRMTATRAGKYLITGCIEFNNNTTGVRAARILLNGATVIAGVSTPAPGAGTEVIRLSPVTIYNLAATDYVELQGWQDSGGNLNANATANVSPEFGMIYIGD